MSKAQGWSRVGKSPTPGSAKFNNARKICSTPGLKRRENAPQPCDGEGREGLGATGTDLC